MSSGSVQGWVFLERPRDVCARGLTAEPAKPLKKGVVPTHPACDAAVAPHRLQKAGNSGGPPSLLYMCQIRTVGVFLPLANVRRAKNTVKRRRTC